MDDYVLRKKYPFDLTRIKCINAAILNNKNPLFIEIANVHITIDDIIGYYIMHNHDFDIII